VLTVAAAGRDRLGAGGPVLDQAAFGSISALGWGAAVAVGLAVREVETRRRTALEDVRTGERMELARELHDVVAHHVTGIVVAAQAAAVVARQSPRRSTGAGRDRDGRHRRAGRDAQHGRRLRGQDATRAPARPARSSPRCAR
jgi:hypothetical protein